MLLALQMAATLAAAPVVAADSVVAPPARIEVTPIPASLAPEWADAAQRPRAIVYSDLYYTRLKIHKIASYATLPLFIGEFIVGEQLYHNGPTGDQSLLGLHKALATGVDGLFVINTVTGAWNLWDSRHDPEGRTRRWIHSALMIASDIGFVATGALAPNHRTYANGTSDAGAHQTVAIASMSAALGSYLMMLLWKD
ncbi:MAG TPA: hypothetical protein VFI39_04535 [Gemmatimonadales bacterium]|nr:hypothetical protein [Gemmatimonadales bacterium]